MAGVLALRFDIDTVRCARAGLPALLALAREEGCRFTFFVNMGRSIARRPGLRRRHKKNADIHKFRVYHKLRFHELCTTLLLNPMVGARAIDNLHQAIAEGHELGLHGGINHGLWQHTALTWNRKRVYEEVEAGLALMAKAQIPRPTGFASPGFTHPPTLIEVLRELGFNYVADQHSPDVEVLSSQSVLPNTVNTNIIGMPGNVGYIEWCIAKNISLAGMRDNFEQHLRSHRTALMYDHPSVAGQDGLERLRLLIQTARNINYSIATIGELIKHQSVAMAQ